MFESIAATPKEIAFVYMSVFGACLALVPLSMLVMNAVNGLRGKE